MVAEWWCSAHAFLWWSFKILKKLKGQQPHFCSFTDQVSYSALHFGPESSIKRGSESAMGLQFFLLKKT